MQHQERLCDNPQFSEHQSIGKSQIETVWAEFRLDSKEQSRDQDSDL